MLTFPAATDNGTGCPKQPRIRY